MEEVLTGDKLEFIGIQRLHICENVLNIYLGENLLDHEVCKCSALRGGANMFPK